MNKIKVSFCTLILMLLWAPECWAQFDPPNPQEPFIQYKVELECNPPGVAGLSGQGSYADGGYVYISTYPYNSNYQFQYWELNGEVYTRNTDFMYRINTRDVKFIAHYEYKPYDPDEPNAHFMRRLYLKSQPEGVASYNIPNGQKFELGSNIWIYETGRNWQYEFKGWYDGDELVSNSVDFGYTIPDRDVTLIARYEFNPSSPSDPGTFYSSSCDFLAEPNDINKGTVAVDGLVKGRAVFGSTLTLVANPSSGHTFCGWYMRDSLLSVNSGFLFTVPSSYNRIRIVADFKYKPHNLTYKLDDEIVATFVEETGSLVTILPDVERDGYSFSGWQGIPDTMPDADVVITGSLRLTNIRISQPKIELEGGDKKLLSVYAGLSSKEGVNSIIWNTDNPEIATITENGVIKGISAGSTHVTAKFRDDTLVYALSSVIVASDNHKVDLPPVDFEFNYNAVNYDAGNNRIANDLDAILYRNNLQLTENIPEFTDSSKLTITGLCKGYIDKWSLGSEESGQYFKRIGNDNLTIVCKVKPRTDLTSNKSDFISVNSTSNTNYSLRIGYRTSVYLATRNGYADRYVDYQPGTDIVLAVRANGEKVVIQNLTTGETKAMNGNTWGATGGSMNFFNSSNSNYYVGDFYWAYLAKDYLTDSEIWDVVDYNDNVDKYAMPSVLLGDVNNSGVVNVTDISNVVEYMFGNYPPVFNYKASDVNLSREVNVADIAGIVNLIFGLPATNLAARRGNADLFSNGVEIISSQITPGGEGIVKVKVNNTARISAAEMNIRLPQGLTVIDADFEGNDDNRVFRSGYVDGVYKLVTYSMENNTLSGNDGALFTLKVKASQDMKPALYDILVTDIVLSGNGDEIKVEPIRQSISVDGETTLVPDTESKTEIRTYDLVGREVDPNSVKNGPYIVRELKDGKVVRTYKVIR